MLLIDINLFSRTETS